MTLKSHLYEKISNGRLAKQVLEEILSIGVEEFCLCPGSRNAPFVYPLAQAQNINVYYWPEERSAAFFALGRIKATGNPIAVVTTSGTAAAELLPATIEAYYTGLPLILLTADRPRRFRGSGAPQSIEQVGLFSQYVHETQDVEGHENCCLLSWKQQGPIHLNICFEEPEDSECQLIRIEKSESGAKKVDSAITAFDRQFLGFLEKTKYPLIVVGSLDPQQKEGCVDFLNRFQAPVYLEGVSGIREDPRLESLRITHVQNIWAFAEENQYPIDGILRLGGVPTARLWRDLEYKAKQIAICSVSDYPFSGLSHADVIHISLMHFFECAKDILKARRQSFGKWKEADKSFQNQLHLLFEEFPQSEPSLIHALSKKIPIGSKIYLGNSLPIREWDRSASYASRQYQMACSRGANGIDGQFATFLGYSCIKQENWAILGDLTLLYDLVAPWITSQLLGQSHNLVVVNNGGSGIFARMYAHPAFQNQHQLNFEPLAQFWGWQYERWEDIPQSILPHKGNRLIELIPNVAQTAEFLLRLKAF